MSQKFIYIETLKKAGYSNTAARQKVFEVLLGQEPQTMAEVASSLQNTIDRASLYRTIALFEQLGIVQRLQMGFKYKLELTDLFSDHHHHISCLGCGKIVALTEHEQIERMITVLAKRHGMTAEKHQLEIQGYCASCSVYRT